MILRLWNLSVTGADEYMKKTNFPPLDVTEVLLATKEGILLLGSPITDMELKSLQEEVRALKQFRIWKIMQETIRHKAIEKGITLSTQWEEVLAAKMMLHDLGIMKSVVDAIEGYKTRAASIVPPSTTTYIPTRGSRRAVDNRP